MKKSMPGGRRGEGGGEGESHPTAEYLLIPPTGEISPVTPPSNFYSPH